MTADPGAPRTDELARNAALHAIADHIEAEDSDADGQYCAGQLLRDLITSVTWETDVNSAGVPVRRYVLRGAWEVDLARTRTALDAMPAPDPVELARPVPPRNAVVSYNGRQWRVGPSEVTKQGWTCLDMVATDGSNDEANCVPHFKVEWSPETSPGDHVEWHLHTKGMWVGEGYGAKVLVEIDTDTNPGRQQWRAKSFDGRGILISDAPLTLAKAKWDGVKYLWSRRDPGNPAHTV